MMADSFAMSSVDVRAVEVFAVSSALFWRSRQELVLGFFRRLQQLNTSGLLVGRTREVCESASARGILCATGQNFTHKQDPMGTMERFSVIRHFLARGQRIIFAGVDVRFVRPACSMCSSALADAAGAVVDGAFEANVWWHSGVIGHFTPDVIVAFPTTNMLYFVDAVLARYTAPLLDGLPPELRVAELQKHPTRLKGPAQQDMLYDVLISTLSGATCGSGRLQLPGIGCAAFPIGEQSGSQSGRAPRQSSNTVCADVRDLI